ncbi:MAG: CxxxxCH/CxxCH domain-containing protein [Deferrisomatales bacterium]|nr:CxxxxCH/CxxCH domain-containing protein [Deferrisomatales bacterium]
MRNTRTLLCILVAGVIWWMGPSVCWADNTRTIGFGLANAYQPGSCTFCHGNGTTGQYWPDDAPASSYPDRAYDHDQHVLALAQSIYGENLTTLLTDTTGTGGDTSDAKQLAICGVCHPNPGQSRAGTGEASHVVDAPPAQTADVHGDGRAGADPSNFRTITGAAQLVQGTYDNTTVANGKDCSNVDCHYRVTTPTTGTALDGWYNAAAVATCSNCHGGGTTGAHLPNAHQAHVATTPATNNSAPGKNYACTQCHPDHGINTSHQQGAIDLTFAVTSWEPGTDGPGSQTGSDLEVKFGQTDGGVTHLYATCSNFYCHGSELNNGGTNQTPLWSDFTTGNCGTCHGVNANPVAIGRVAGKAVTSANHLTHFTDNRGPRLTDQHLSEGCYQCHPSIIAANHAADCNDCHPSYWDGVASNMGGAIALGASNPTPTHVDGKVDFGNTNQTVVAQSVLGATAPPGAPDATSTDRCNNCHSNSTVEAKTNWPTDPYFLPCEDCHGALAVSAWSKADGAASAVPVVKAPDKFTYFTARGHGLAGTSTYPWSSARNGANAACTDCHDTGAVHINHAVGVGDDDRLSTSGNALCNSCHDGTGPGSAVSQVSTHANTSTTMTNVYTAQRAAMELNCIECHDVHGSANIFMINEVNPDGPLVAVRLYQGNDADDEPPPVSPPPSPKLFNGTVVFTNDASGADYAVPAADATKICQTCHTQTGHYQFNSDDGHVVTDCITCHKHEFDDNTAADSQDGFMPSGCDGCHGFPPAPVGATTPPLENYPGGGGAHQQHVDFLIAQLSIPPTEVQGRAVELCGPCHGEDPLANHAQSNQAADAWPIAARGEVNIVARTQSSWGAAGTYRGQEVDPTDVVPNPEGGAKPPGSAMTNANSLCANLDCHGDADPGENLHWNVDTAGDTAGDPEDGLARSQVCEGCHDQTPAQVRVYDAAGALQYAGDAPDTAANYYATISGYGRGGHGDPEIRNEDPFINSGTGNTPIDCTACHADGALHFPADSANLHRLATIELENTSHTGAGLCNSCHGGGTYPGPGNHHPSLRGTANNATKDIVVTAASQEVRQLPTTWFEVSTDHYEQDGYSAANASGNPDAFVDWWGGNPNNANQSPPPQPSPFAVVPLLQFVGNQSGQTNAVMCVTCHNPHGTDLYVFDPGGIGKNINDNNMLRLRDEDNTLCNACH